ncbi:MAG: DUF1576 domain-containing protein [Tissierella sp.]|uniref:DUF1576 domain-containing protein n=1 Tax=Tissierella sp. TaxID=41274 RepID=UPI003F971C0A
MVSRDIVVVKEDTKYKVLFMYASIIFFSAFLFNTPSEIFEAMKKIVVSPSILLTDYISVGNLGAAFLNSGLLLLIALFISKLNKVSISGPIIASTFIIAGFAFFGKNIYNIWGLFLGVYVYSLTQDDSFNKFIIVAFFGTGLAPIISQISFGFGFDPVFSILISNAIGVICGFLLPPLANHFISFHQGFSLYNVGFTIGIIGSLFMSIFRSFGLENETQNILSAGNNKALGFYFICLFISMIILGFFLNDKSFKGYKHLLTYTGRLVADFVNLSGFGLSLINMGLLGLLSLLYVLLINGDLNGPVIGGIFTVVGFGAFGKHPKNVFFIVIGVYIATIFNTWEPNSTNVILAALFGTCLAPIPGKFGWKYGIIAGILHLSVVMNIGYLHGGMNLYNNGFAGGLVAAFLVPTIESFRRG